MKPPKTTSQPVFSVPFRHAAFYIACASLLLVFAMSKLGQNVVNAGSVSGDSTSTAMHEDIPTERLTDTSTATEPLTDTPTDTVTPTPAASPELIYGMTAINSWGGNPGINLVSFSSIEPGTITTIGPFTGVVPGQSLRSIDFRPATGQLFAISTNSTVPVVAQLYTVDLTTAQLTPVGSEFTLGTTESKLVEIEFNPVTDKIRILTGSNGISGANNNFRVDPNNGTLEAIDANLVFAAGDPREGRGNFGIAAAAYADNIAGAASTTLYAWDFGLDALVTIGGMNGTPNPNSGLMFTINTPPPYITARSGIGMDISGATGTLYVTHDQFYDDDEMGLYTRSTTTGLQSFRGFYPSGIFVADISVFIPSVTPSPTPTATSTAADTPTQTPTPPAVINGTVTYANADVPPRFVSHVLMSGSGSIPVSVFTDAPGGTAGQYSLSGFGEGSYTITPSKTGGQNGAINSFDAARVAQHVSSINPLTGNALLVADVSGNGTISSFDSALVAGYVLGFDGGSSGEWKFDPANKIYPSITDLMDQDYAALLMGEVSGNWTNTGSRPAGKVESGKWKMESEDGGPERSISVELPQLTAVAGKEIIVPINVKGIASKGVISYEFDLSYDPDVIQPMENPVDVKATASRGFTAMANATKPGILRVVVYGAIPIGENGSLLNLRFAALGMPGSVSPLTWQRIMFNEGKPPVSTTDGRIELF